MTGVTLRRLGRAAYVAYGGSIIAVVMLTLWLVTALVRGARRAVALQRLASRVMLACLGCRFGVRGARLPAGPCVLVANHTSYLDIPLMLAALDCDFAFVTKHELLEWPIISLITRAGGHIPVDRDRLESRGAVVARIVKALRAGRAVMVFPEGTFSHDDRLRPFQVGAFKAAVAAGVPVVPLATTGVERVWSQHARFPRAGRVEIAVGEALMAGAGPDADEVEALRAAALAFIEGCAASRERGLEVTDVNPR